MGDQRVDHTAFKRINKFNDDKTEQVWELFREEFARASVAEDGETSWRCAAGIMSVDDINKQITEEDAATIISDIASSSSSSIQVAMIMLQQFIPNSEDADVLKDIRKEVKAGENQYPSFDAFDLWHDTHKGMLTTSSATSRGELQLRLQ